MQRIIHVSSLPPTACGIAEYTAALASAMFQESPGINPFYVRLDLDPSETRQDDQQVTVNPSDRAALQAVARIINQFGQKTVLLQHEFKLYGGNDGEHVSWLLGELNCPIVTTLHTVWPSFPSIRQRVFLELLDRSNKLVVFSEIASNILQASFGVVADKIVVVPHGVPDVPFRNIGETDHSGLPVRAVRFITAGLLRPAKGIEQVLAALANVKKQFSDFAYVVCGTDHPRNAGAKDYRQRLVAAISAYGLENHVFFVDRFLGAAELAATIQACDVGVLPYTSPHQSSSGVLALMLGCGRPVIATDFQYAKAVLDGSNGILVPDGDISALANAIVSLGRNLSLRTRMARTSYDSTRSWIWPTVAKRHLDVLNESYGQKIKRG